MDRNDADFGIRNTASPHSRRQTLAALLGGAVIGGVASANGIVAGKKKKKKWRPAQMLGSEGTANNQLSGPQKVVLSADQLTLYIADTGNNRIAVWHRSTTTGSWQAGTPIGSGPGRDFFQFDTPTGVAVTSDGLELYVADYNNNRITQWTYNVAHAEWVHTIGAIGTGPGSRDHEFDGPNGVTISPDGLNLFVADQRNNRISIWSRTAVGERWLYSTQFGTLGDQSNNFHFPDSSIITSDGFRLYVADQDNNRIAVWKRSGLVAWRTVSLSNFGTSDMKPGQMAISSDELRAYVPELTNDRVSIWTRPTTNAVFEEQGAIGTASEGTATNQFNQPSGVALSANGRELYVADSNNNRISMWQYK